MYVGPVRIFYTMCTFGRLPVFTTTPTVAAVRDQLLLNAASCDVDILAYCFMPDHLHYLAEGLTEAADLRNFTRGFRQRSGYQYRQQHRSRLWQEGYFDRHLREEDATYDVVSYIVANPIRAGLSRSLAEYPHVGATRYGLEELTDYVRWKPLG